MTLHNFFFFLTRSFWKILECFPVSFSVFLLSDWLLPKTREPYFPYYLTYSYWGGGKILAFMKGICMKESTAECNRYWVFFFFLNYSKCWVMAKVFIFIHFKRKKIFFVWISWFDSQIFLQYLVLIKPEHFSLTFSCQ